MYATADQTVKTPAITQGKTGDISVILSITQPTATIWLTVQTFPVQCGTIFTLR